MKRRAFSWRIFLVGERCFCREVRHTLDLPESNLQKQEVPGGNPDGRSFPVRGGGGG